MKRVSAFRPGTLRPRAVAGLLILLSLLIAFSERPVAAETLAPGPYKALVIGISDYKQPNGKEVWKFLPAAREDAREVAEVLRTKYGFQVTLLAEDQTKRGPLRTALHAFLAGAGKKDNLLIYYAGHGQIDELNIGYWIPRDASRDVVSDAIPVTDLDAWIKRSSARHVLVIVDACYSGTIGETRGDEPKAQNLSPDKYRELLELPSKQALTAGGRELVIDRATGRDGGTLFQGHSPFAYHLLEKLRQNPRTYLNAEDLYAHVFRGVRAWTDYSPRLLPLGSSTDGSFVFLNLRSSDTGAGKRPLVQGPRRDGDAASKLLLTVKAGVRGELKVRGPEGEGRLPEVAEGAWEVSLSTPGFYTLEVVSACLEAPLRRVIQVSASDLGKQWEESLGTQRLKNDCLAGITWVTIPGGSFKMGSDNGENDERPVHRVDVPSFQMSKSEVTVWQYRACVEAGKCEAPHWEGCSVWTGTEWKISILPERFRGDDQPVVCVDWSQARTFASWVGGRLPSEAEWEYAARGHGGRKYAWGELEPSCERAIFDPGGKKGCGKDATWPVCSKPSGNTPEGLCDMTGNAWEWIEDCFQDSYLDALSDGSSRQTCSTFPFDVRGLRGGSWFGNAADLRAARHYKYRSSVRDYVGGFRVARPASRAAGP